MDGLARVAHAIQSNPGVFALLLGSGLSRAAGVPTGWEVTLDLVRAVAVLNNADAGADPAGWWAATYGGEPSYSTVLKTLAPTPAERRRLIAARIEPTAAELSDGKKRPTAAHRAIAKLAADGLVRVIVTTNFDRLIEQALSEIGIEPTVISSSDDAKGAEPLIHSRVVVVKVHGDYLDTRVRNTEKELATLGTGVTGVLDRVFDEFGLVVCGWSGVWDEGLRSAIRRAPNRRYPLYWLHRSKLATDAAELLKQRRGTAIPIETADQAFSKISMLVEALQALAEPPPGDLATLEVVTKKFVVDARHRVALHDLVVDEVRTLRGLLADPATFGDNIAPTHDEIRRRFTIASNLASRLRRLVFVLGYHGTSGHAPLVALALQQLGSPLPSGSSYVAYGDVLKVPMAYAAYALALACVLTNKYEPLADAMRIRFRTGSGADDDIIGLGASRMGGLKDSLNPIGDQRFHAPFSHFARKTLAAESDRVGVIGEPFDLAFDKVEILLCLLHGAGRVAAGRHFWGPLGDFAWKMNSGWQGGDLREWLESAVKSGASWEPIKAGLFHGNVDTLSAAITDFNEFLSRVNWY